MNAELRLAVLGGLHIESQQKPLSGFISNKAQALLIYLAITKTPHSRQSLAGLLWGDMAEGVARTNLRVNLSNLHHLLPQHLVIGRQSIGFDPSSRHWIDSDVFK